MHAVEGILRGEGRYALGGRTVPWRPLAVVLLVGGFVHGAVMGSFDLRLLQPLYSGLKVPLLLAIATLVSLPSFLVINTVLGLREDLGAACRGVLASQATVAIALASMSPVIVLVYLSIDHYRTAIVLNGAIFAAATAAGQVTLNKHYAALIARDRLHHLGRSTWVVLYVFVAVQAAWVLRPFIGTPGLPSQFFREDPWSNAYVVVGRYVADALRNALGG